MNRKTLFIFFCFLIAAFSVGVFLRYPLVTDDPYITYRYARNVVNGVGFVFNAGERVLSTTTPLYTIILALFGLLRADIPTTGYWLSVASLGVAAFLLYALTRQTYPARAADALRAEQRAMAHAAGFIAGALWLVTPALVMTFGLETNFYLALGLGALVAYLSNRVTLAFALGALLTLTRNDGLILTALLACDYFWRQRARLGATRRALGAPQFVRPLLVYLLLLAPWLIFAWLYFGAPFPFTLAAKIAQAQSGLWDPFALGLTKWARDNALWLAPLSVAALFGMTLSARAKTRAWLPLAWALAHLAAYALLGVAFYAWYVAPLMPALCLFAGIGVAGMAEWRALRQNNFLKYGALIACGAFLFGLTLRAAIDAGMTRPSPKVEAYQRAAIWLAQNTPTDATVDALEIGVIGYFDERRTVDFVGLVDPQRVPYLRTRQFADGVRRAQADYVVMIPPDSWLPDDVWFKDAYRVVAQIRVPGFYGNKPLVIYQRADAGGAPLEKIDLNAAFEKRAELQSVELFARAVARGAVLPVKLNLRALDREPIPTDWKFTLQLVGAADRVVAQTDNFYPARLPQAEKPFADYQGIPIPADARAGVYDLILAMYDAQTNERLSFYDANGNEAGDFLNLGKIEITE